MAVMTAGPDPGERRLARPPSERYDEGPGDVVAAPVPGSFGRGLGWGGATAIVGALLTVVLGGGLAISAGLLVLWASAGNAIGLATRIGGGPALRAPRRTWLAVGLALVGVAIGQVGLWLYASSEGGVLPLVEYLASTFGVLVPLQALLAVGTAWWSAR